MKAKKGGPAGLSSSTHAQPLAPLPLESLRAKGLLAKSTPPCLALRVQLLGAELCAALSRTLLSMASTSEAALHISPHASAPAAAAVTTTSTAASTRVEDRCRGAAVTVAARALVSPLAMDLSAHYGRHALRRGEAKPLGPAFRSRAHRSLGTHVGRAWRLWRRRVMSRRWCHRCGVYLQDGLTAVPAETGMTSSTATRATRRVCRRCYEAQLTRCVRHQRQCEARAAEAEAAALTLLANEGTGGGVCGPHADSAIPDLAQAARRMAQVPAAAAHRRVDRALLTHTRAALAAKCAVKRPCRRKRPPSRAQRARTQRRAAKKAARAALVTAPAPAPVVRALVKAVPAGPLGVRRVTTAVPASVSVPLTPPVTAGKPPADASTVKSTVRVTAPAGAPPPPPPPPSKRPAPKAAPAKKAAAPPAAKRPADAGKKKVLDMMNKLGF